MAYVWGPLFDRRELADESAGGAALAPETYVVFELGMGEDARLVPGIPRRGATREFGELVYVCDRVVASRRLNDTTVEVDVYWSTDGRWSAPEPRKKPDESFKPWTITHEKHVITPPCLKLITEEYPTANGSFATRQSWVRDDNEDPRPFEVMVIAQTCVLKNVSAAQAAAAITTAMEAAGEFHVVPLWPNRVLQFNMPTMRQQSPGTLEIAYVWKSDPGSGGRDLQQPFETMDNTVLAPPRPPFGVYRFTRAETTNGQVTRKPLIYTSTLASEYVVTVEGDRGVRVLNPLWRPDGYLRLPGRPLQ